MPLRPNQLTALSNSIHNDFQSGVHFHATGTGKSWISLELILKYHQQYPDHNIFWLCEQKSILVEQFSRQQLKDKGYLEIYHQFMVHNYSELKLATWVESVNASRFWGKPILVIINRAFLVSQLKYQQIKIPIHLIIHDECHSITNSTTQQFYQYILKQYNPKCLGFSATPCLDYQPFDNIISSYSIYDAYLDEVIVPPKIIWYSSNYFINTQKMIELVKDQISQLVYQKIIVWCGLIEECYSLAEQWKQFFPDFHIYTDTSQEDDNHNYLQFEPLETKAILFCACKHREGSDIRNLDCCIFFDKVANRTPKTFIQCLGRVLRRDKKNLKQFGLVIDFNAQSSIKICDRINEFLNLDSSIFPWNYQYHHLMIGQSKKKVTYHELTFTQQASKNDLLLPLNQIIDHQFTHQEIKDRFIRFINLPEYQQRLDLEMDLILSKKLGGHLILATEILKLTNQLPHVTRGSCGSSLVCYFLGISNLDPIKYQVSFARFLNDYRDNLPDIDFDFPHFLRDDVFIKLYQQWPGLVARISNHVYYHEKSAQRQALRELGIRKFISKNEIYQEIGKLNKNDKLVFKDLVSNLTDTFRNYSLHCGGIVFFPKGIPLEYHLNNHKMMSQVMLNKEQIAQSKQFKIDILSSRALSQLYYASTYLPHKNLCDFTNLKLDSKVIDMLSKGDNLGITLAESPLMRKALMLVKPQNIEQLAICLAIIRPAAKDARMSLDYQDKFIFDDDAIQIIAKIMNCDEGQADKYRRGFAKKDSKTIQELTRKASQNNQKELLDKLKNLRKYSFCKSHAISYAQLVWQLAYLKAYNPKIFWKATLLYCQTSYRKWVHYYQAHLAGIDYKAVLIHQNKSVYSQKKKENFDSLTVYEQMRQFGYWNIKDQQFFPGCYLKINTNQNNKPNNINSNNIEESDSVEFRGLIASSRMLSYNHKQKKNKMVLYIGTGNNQYTEVLATIDNFKFKHKSIGIFGVGIVKNQTENIIESDNILFF